MNTCENYETSAPGREAVLSTVTQALIRNQVVALLGPPGVGKTRLAAQICDQWSGPALRLGIDDSIAHVSELVSSSVPFSNLLFIDSAEAVVTSWPTGLTDWLEAGSERRVLLTTRRRGPAPNIAWLDICPMTTDEALAHLGPSEDEQSRRAIANALKGSVGLLEAAGDLLSMMGAREVALMAVSEGGLAQLADWAGLSVGRWLDPDLTAAQCSLLRGCAWLPGGAPFELLCRCYPEASPGEIRRLRDLGMLRVLPPLPGHLARVKLPPAVRAALASSPEEQPPAAMLQWATCQALALSKDCDASLLDSLAAVCRSALRGAPDIAAQIAVCLAHHPPVDWVWLDAVSILTQLADLDHLPAAQRANLCLAMAHVRAMAGHRDTRDWLERAHSLGASLPDLRLRANIALARGTRMVVEGERERGTLVLMTGLEDARSGDHMDLAGALLAQLGGFHAAEGMYRTGLELMTQALQTLRAAGETERANRVNSARAELLGAMGQTEDAKELLRRCQHAGNAGSPYATHVYAQQEMRSGAPAVERLSRARDGYRQHGDLVQSTRVVIDLAVCMAEQGHVESASTSARRALAQLSLMGVLEYEAEGWLKLALIELLACDYTAAGRSLAEAQWRAETRYPVIASRCDVLLSALALGPASASDRLDRLFHRSPGEDPVLDQMLAGLASADEVSLRSLGQVHSVVARVLARTLLARRDAGMLRQDRSEPGPGRFVASARSVAVALAAGRLEQACGLARQLVLVAKDSDDPRQQANARFWTWATGPRDAATLLELAGSNFPGPRARRRARALLSLPSELDAEDQQVLRALEPRLAWTVSGRCDADRVPYLLDHGASELVHPGGGRTCLQRCALLFQVLQLLARRGALSKESLSESLWPGDTYHPLLHDNRLRVAVHRLRKLCLVEIVRTTDDGYALSHPVLEVLSRTGQLTGVDWRRVSLKLTPSGLPRRET